MVLANEIKGRIAVTEEFNHRPYLARLRRSGRRDGGRYQGICNAWQQDNRSQRHKQIRQHLQDEP